MPLTHTHTHTEESLEIPPAVALWILPSLLELESVSITYMINTLKCFNAERCGKELRAREE